ncbi:MAG: DUF4919 domain-containing protein [Bacteroidia bacterium]
MKRIILIAFLLLNILSYSQDLNFEKPNYKKIEKSIKKKKSNFYYEALMKRFLQGDSTMNLDEKRHLYYGYSFNKKYSPYNRSEYSDSVKLILNKENLDSLDHIKIVNFTDNILSSNPFDLRALNYQLYSLEKLGDEIFFARRVEQLRVIIHAIMSSGNGKSKNEAFYVISVSHEYDILNLLGYQFGGSQSLSGYFDYLTLEENNDDLKGLYFEISPSLNWMSKMFK